MTTVCRVKFKGCFAGKRIVTWTATRKYPVKPDIMIVCLSSLVTVYNEQLKHYVDKTNRADIYLWFNVVLELVHEVPRWTVSSDNEDFAVIALGLANS